MTLTGVATGCSDGKETGSGQSSSTTAIEAQRTEILAALVDGVIVPAYRELVTATSGWAEASETLCARPGSETLERVRQAWRDSVVAYEATVAHNLGPAMELRLMSDLAFTPREASIESLLAGDSSLAVSDLANRGANVRGLYAAELALFGDASEELTSGAGARRCRYLASVATLSDEAARAVADEWTSGSARADFLKADGSDPDDTLPLLLNDVTHAVKAVDEKGLRDMAAAASYEDLVDGRRDGPGEFGLAKRRARLRGAVMVTGSQATGLVAIVAQQSPATARRLKEASDAAIGAMDELGDSVASAFETPEAAANLDAAAEAVAALKVQLATEVAAQLGVTITLSDSDGDS